jgi:hypothetical protein
MQEKIDSNGRLFYFLITRTIHPEPHEQTAQPDFSLRCSGGGGSGAREIQAL